MNESSKMNKNSIFKQVQHPQDVSDFYHIYNKSNILNVLYWNEYFEMVLDIEGSIVECGVGRGRSLITILALQQYYNEVSKRRVFAFERLNSMKSISCVNAQGAFYLFPKISDVGMKSAQFCDELLSEAKVAAVPGIAFGADDYIRISYATSMENLEKGLARLEGFVESL